MSKKVVQEISLKKIFPNPDQPRKHFDPDKLQELAMSIEEYGVQEPIKVVPKGREYMIVMGERRYRASHLAGKETIPAIVENLTDEEIEELALLENLQREDLNIIEEAKAFQSLLNRGMSKEELAKKLGFKQLWRIDERTSLLKLSEEYQSAVIRGDITNSQAFEMSRLPVEKQSLLLRKIQEGGLNTYNRLRAFVDGLLLAESQGAFFSLTILDDKEREALDTFKSSISSIERFLNRFHTAKASSVLKKVTLHTDIDVSRIDLIIQNLQKIRKCILSGEGIKEAVKAA
jgi:ParB family chromosome partitioning protein